MKPHRFITYTLLALAFSLSSMANNYVIINQIMYDAPRDELSGSLKSYNGEFIELYNAGTTTVSLQGWKLIGSGIMEFITFSDISIPASGYLIVAYCGIGSNFQLPDTYTLPSSPNFTILYQNKIVLGNNGETLTLRNAQNDTIDQIHYDGNDDMNNPYLLYAPNADLISVDSCVSLHRKWVEFDADGKTIPGPDQWQTDLVSFGESILPYASYFEHSVLGEQSLPLGENYILTISPLDPVTRIDMNNGSPSVSSGIRTRTNIIYMDGLGRQNEVISLGITPERKDLVSVYDYHGKSKVSRLWLPAVMETDGQRINPGTIRSQAQTNYSDTCPYTETFYESSALGRAIGQKRPGMSYANHPATQTYSMNNSNDNVRIYTVKTNNSLFTDGSYYNTATLYKNTVADEDGKSVITFTDKLGRKIMEERGGSRTYYVYDDLGRLRYILPNLSASQLTNGTYSITSNAVLKGTAYYYLYDGMGNITYKKLPGCDAQYMIYDRTGQLILKQDGNQRNTNKWTLFAYDSIGRNVYTAEIVSPLQSWVLSGHYEDTWQVERYVGNQSGSIPGVGYTCTAYGANNPRMLSVNYYDNYDYLSLMSLDEQNQLEFAPESGFGHLHDNSTGLLTGTRVYNLSEGGSSTTANYYDIKGLIIQSRSTRNDGGYISTKTEYLFDGSIAQQLTEQGTDGDMVREHYRYTYDHAGRTKNVLYQLKNDTEITLSAFSYDSLGHLAQNLLHNSRDSIVYSYDMRNMLTRTQNKHFSERLYYADDLSDLAVSVTPCHNGNIAASTLKLSRLPYSFAFAYDSKNRLTNCSRIRNGRTLSCETYKYSASGDMERLQRYNGNRLIDDLNYSYTSNGHQLQSIADNGNDQNLYNVIEYHNADLLPQITTTMGYDSNGNLIYDLDRGISVIHYNSLNLPDTVQFVNGNQIVNLYDAAGRKYKSISYTNIASTIIPRYEIMHYSSATDSIEFSVTEYAGSIENYYSLTDTTRRIHNTTGYYTDSTYYHYIKDHLGNICAVVNSATNIPVQQTLYYPSGVPIAQSTGRDVQPYLYNGKEFVEMHGLNTYDFGFRGYYATIGRFTSIDPLAEQNPWQSPYSYAGNRFVNAIDWMGLGAYTTTDAKEIARLLAWVGEGRSVNNFDTRGWNDVTDKWEHGFTEKFGDKWWLFVCTAGPGGGGGWSGDIANVEISRVVNASKFAELCKAVGEFAAEGLEAGTLGINAWISDQWNPFGWDAANGKHYDRRFLHKRGGYANSFKVKGKYLANKTFLGKFGTGLSALSVGIALGDMIQNGSSVKSGIDFGVASAGLAAGTVLAGTMFGAELVLFCTIYGLADIGVTHFTGNSISGWIDYGVHQGINYFTEEY